MQPNDMHVGRSTPIIPTVTTGVGVRLWIIESHCMIKQVSVTVLWTTFEVTHLKFGVRRPYRQLAG